MLCSASPSATRAKVTMEAPSWRLTEHTKFVGNMTQRVSGFTPYELAMELVKLRSPSMLCSASPSATRAKVTMEAPSWRLTEHTKFVGNMTQRVSGFTPYELAMELVKV
ncbi:hypothetical protein TREES_T100010077 [Tupaia chinensis]|uniref:Uncharacterized protein n=1 Tax=Tupaia chinensis TaxID=246437 RepID=L9KI13_TUPCH|nr:hypothetical protein TREES_T100010077 [Tupaia chinensis]